MSKTCACGQPLHYTDPKTRAMVERMIVDLGPAIAVRTSAGCWMVPRHYIALHGLKAFELPELAARLGFEPAPDWHGCKKRNAKPGVENPVKD